MEQCLRGQGIKKKKKDYDTLLFDFLSYLISPSKDRHAFILFYF